MTIEQTIEIPADHRLTLEIPREIPPGTAKIELTITPAKKGHTKESLLSLAGSLRGSPNFGGSGVEIQRKMRDEW
jgi:hypothetical protein